jgi:hypothetical protein
MLKLNRYPDSHLLEQQPAGNPGCTGVTFDELPALPDGKSTVSPVLFELRHAAQPALFELPV